MPDLITLLKTQDYKFLRMIADLWDVPARGADKRALTLSLAELLGKPDVFNDFYEGLTVQSREALNALKQAGGLMAWTSFTRQNGELRPMGPAKRDREQPWHFPVSTTEYLYYRALIGREFIRVDDELIEMAFLPEEFLHLLPDVPEKEKIEPQKSISPIEAPMPDKQNSAALQIVDDYCTLFAASRLGDLDHRLAQTKKPSRYWQALRALGDDLGLFDHEGFPTDLARALLERPRHESQAWLVNNWANTRTFNELRLTPDLRCDGSWRNEPLRARRKVLSWLFDLPVGQWYRLDDFVAFIKENDPDFLRQGADYDVWMIHSESTGELLRGVKSWQQVEPRFLEYFITRWMFWLGLTHVHQGANGDYSFVLSQGMKVLAGSPNVLDVPKDEKDEPLIAQPNGLILMSDKTAPIARYQVARFAEWLELGPTHYSYQLTPASLTKAGKAGLNTRQLLGLLRKYGKSAPPPSLVKALNRWQEHGAEASLETLTVLRLKTPEILKALKDSEAKAWIGDSLGPVTVVIKPGGIEKVQKALARLGYLSDFDIQGRDE
jgi:hypothetical protein